MAEMVECIEQWLAKPDVQIKVYALLDAWSFEPNTVKASWHTFFHEYVSGKDSRMFSGCNHEIAACCMKKIYQSMPTADPPVSGPDSSHRAVQALAAMSAYQEKVKKDSCGLGFRV